MDGIQRCWLHCPGKAYIYILHGSGNLDFVYAGDLYGVNFTTFYTAGSSLLRQQSMTVCCVAGAQQAVLSAGCIPALATLAASPDAELRLNAVWALQNLVYTAPAEVRAAVCNALSWRAVVDLTNDMQTEVQVGCFYSGRF